MGTEIRNAKHEHNFKFLGYNPLAKSIRSTLKAQILNYDPIEESSTFHRDENKAEH